MALHMNKQRVRNVILHLWTEFLIQKYGIVYRDYRGGGGRPWLGTSLFLGLALARLLALRLNLRAL